ncbi:MAG: HPr family phosphocarrier protein [Acholeplasmataceae bacterium]|jgi:phosphocarrier protein|nr:HPr family phosphocarrier protein [Acholeplasmataceae bacterium]
MVKEIIIKNTKGLHASLAVKLVQAASKYAVEIELHYKDKTIDLKSILGLMSLAIPPGENVRIVAHGNQAELAIKDIESILKRKEG